MYVFSHHVFLGSFALWDFSVLPFSWPGQSWGVLAGYPVAGLLVWVCLRFVSWSDWGCGFGIDSTEAEYSIIPHQRWETSIGHPWWCMLTFLSQASRVSWLLHHEVTICPFSCSLPCKWTNIKPVVCLWNSFESRSPYLLFFLRMYLLKKLGCLSCFLCPMWFL